MNRLKILSQQIRDGFGKYGMKPFRLSFIDKTSKEGCAIGSAVLASCNGDWNNAHNATYPPHISLYKAISQQLKISESLAEYISKVHVRMMTVEEICSVLDSSDSEDEALSYFKNWIYDEARLEVIDMNSNSELQTGFFYTREFSKDGGETWEVSRKHVPLLRVSHFNLREVMSGNASHRPEVQEVIDHFNSLGSKGDVLWRYTLE